MHSSQWRARRKEGRWCGHGQTGGAPHAHQACATCMCVGASTAVERDPCNAPRVAPSASHNNRTVAATRCATQRAHASLTRAAPHSHAQGDGSKQLKGTATTNSQGAQARTATLIHLPLVEVALALVQRGALAMAHAHRSAAAEHGERCSHHLLLAAPAPHPRNRRQATKGENKLSSRHGTHSRVTAHSHRRSSTPSNGTSVQQHTATALLPPLSLRAQLLSPMPPQGVLPLDTRLSGLTGHAAGGAPSAQQHSTAPPLSLHRIGSAPLRARLLPQHTQAAWLVRHLSHLRFLTPPTATQIDGQRDGHGGAWSLSLRLISVRPR
ncbi:hypothetical protein, conserved in T.vivax [Trypanosoma vivax Y486]|uniref:Uncharacterized protein n=1 Tax=Trypanosoma vivax (strain Y486) TaxID=1055687 RepID=F9WTH2_TRYVY|nr:hypothetical protein, conserved in T.vivax [Trypanosoma vivax Y486]|eukprot:CCD20865.1 hypothetical protein, conserved in T.vivax [Trypanosoma vivax Y486]